MVDLRSLDDIPVPDRWDEIRAAAEHPELALTSASEEPAVRRRPLLVAAVVLLVVGAVVVLARATDPEPTEVAESNVAEVVLYDDPRITLASLGPEPVFDTSDLGDEVVWDRQPPDSTVLLVLANAEIPLLGDAEIRSFEVLGRVEDRLYASRVAVGDWVLEEDVDAAPAGARDLLAVDGGTATLEISDALVSLTETAGQELRIGGSYSDEGPEGDGIVIVQGVGPDASVVTLETGTGKRFWMRPAGGMAVFPVTLNDSGNSFVRALDASGVLLETTTNRPDPDANTDTASELGGPFQLDADEWLYPANLPDGFALDVALVSQDSNELLFRDAGDGVIQISLIRGSFTAGPPDESVDIDGAEWFLSANGLFLSQDTSMGTVSVSAPGLPDDMVIATVASLEIHSTDQLPRPVIDIVDGPWVDVAAATATDRAVTLSVATDGRSYATRDSTVPGSLGICCERLAGNELVRLAATTSVDLDTQRLLVRGLVDESVARIEVTLADGTSFDLAPQDLDDAFPIDFVFADVPTLEAPNAMVRAIAPDGTELGSTTGVFPHLVVTRSLVPSQSLEDALRDGIVPELAALAVEDRVSPLPLIRPTDVHGLFFDDGTQWLLSQPDLDEDGFAGCLGDTTGIYGIDFVCLAEYAEILRFGPERIERAYPFPGLAPQSLTATNEAIYCFRQGDGGLSTSMLCRIDLVTGELTARLFPSTIDPGYTDASGLLDGWVLDDPQPILFETLTATDDGRLIITGPDGSRIVDPVTLELGG